MFLNRLMIRAGLALPILTCDIFLCYSVHKYT